MRGEGGKFGQLGLANGEPPEGSAPAPRPRPPLRPQRECVRLAQCAWRLGLSAGARQAVRELQPPPPPAAAFASSAAAEPGAGKLARPRQPSPAPAQIVPTLSLRRGSKPQPPPPGEKVEEEIQPLARAHHPSWTIMIPSKPMTTCSPKRTGIETCSWTQRGRSSRERSATSPARRSPPPGAARLAGLWGSGLRTGSRRAQAGAGAGDARPPGGGVLGYRRGAEGGAPRPQSPRTQRLSAGRWGRPRAGRLGAGYPGRPAAVAPAPRGQGAGAVLRRLGLSPGLGGS